jgi:hypothetical protein
MFSSRNLKQFGRSKSTTTNVHSLTARSSKNYLIELSNDPLHHNMKEIYENCINSIKIAHKYNSDNKLLYKNIKI